ncbi:MAG: SusD/RagB family nutrient-binding outer membrane lipoprotein, partial [Sphingobacteriaceae bacterium]
MTMITKRFATISAIALVLLTSCTKDFEKINTNNNNVGNALPESLLTPAIYDVVGRNNNRALRLTNELMQDHVTVNNGDEIHRYIIRASESDYMWNNWYLQLTNFRDMYNTATALNQTSLAGIALVCDIWVSSLITDTYGDVPYTDSNKGKEGLSQPKFDKQQDIYASLFLKLEEANRLLTINQTLTDDQIALDPLYGVNVPVNAVAGARSTATLTLWRKFCNSLYLRLLMRASARSETNAATKIQEIVATPAKYPIFANNAESAVLKYTLTAPYVSPFNTYRDFDFSGDNGLSEFFLNTLNNWNDPRRAKWATTVGGTYLGIPSGYASGQVPERQSAYALTLKNEPLLGNIINYPELQFLLAEAALKGYITADPKTYYDNGVTNAITFWGFTLPADYFNNPTLAW